MNDNTIRELKLMANNIRKDIMDIAYLAQGPSHPAPALSSADLVTALYFHIMNVDPKHPQWEDRDRFVISKGHACPVIYAALAEKGFFPKEWLPTVRRVGSHLQGHPDMKKTPGIDMTSGSLGNGLSAALGMAIYLKHEKKNSQVYCLLGDGEIQEGLVWEAILAAPAMGMDNLTAIVDCNHLQSCGAVPDIQDISAPSMARAWEALGWNVIRINGHNMEEIVSAFERARDFRGMPTCIMADTVKGKGVTAVEETAKNHSMNVGQEVFDAWLAELHEKQAAMNA